jgi:plasmid stabilization system protein ParE
MTLPIRLLPEAQAEFVAATDWYEQRQTGLGAAFVVRVREVLQQVAAHPRRCPIVYQDVRKALVRRFPHIVLYREEAGEILVIAVFHTARDPSIWQGRV